MASVNIFNDNQIIRYLKELCLLLIWVSSLVIAITTTARQIPAEREQRTLLPLLAKPLSADAIDFREIPRLLARLRPGAALLLRLLRRARREPRTRLAAAELFSGRVFALGHARRRHCDDAARLARFRRAVVQFHDLFRHRRGDSLRRQIPRHAVALSLAEPVRSVIYAFYYAIPHLEIPFEMRNLIVHDWPLIGWKFVALDTLYLLAYTAIFLVAACLVFRRKAVN